MGCFDFTYADNGCNIQGRNGYLYLTKKAQEAMKWKTPYISFDYTDEYGDICLNDDPACELDIYAVYTVMLAQNGCIEMTDEMREHVHKFTQFFHAKPKDRDYSEMQKLMDAIREPAIHYFFEHIEHDVKLERSLPKIGNQPAKTIRTTHAFHGDVPLIITRKKINDTIGTYADEIATALGVVSGDDPNQGFTTTRGLWFAYIRK